MGPGCVRVPFRHEAVAERERICYNANFPQKIRRILSSSLIHKELLMVDDFYVLGKLWD